MSCLLQCLARPAGGALGLHHQPLRARSGCSARKPSTHAPLAAARGGSRASVRARVDPAQHPGTRSRSILVHLLLHLPPAAAVSSSTSTSTFPSSSSSSSRLLLQLQLGQFHIIVSASYFHQFPDLSPSRFCFWIYFYFLLALCVRPPPSPHHHRGAMT